MNSRYAIMDKTSGELLRDYVPATTTRRTYKRKTRDIRNDIIGALVVYSMGMTLAAYVLAQAINK